MKYLLLFIIFTFQLSLIAKDVPTLTGPVVDQANLFSSSFEQKLGQILQQYKNNTGAQLQVLTIESLEDESLESYSIKVTDRWKLGDASKDNGLLFLISKADRKMRIEVGRGLEGEITDILAGRIIEQAKPYFRQQRYEDGTFFIMNTIVKLIGGEIKASTISKKSRKKGLPFWIVIIFLIFIFGRSRRNRSHWIYYSGGGSNWGGGSSGGGWSGGGGGFSGGGSSGSW